MIFIHTYESDNKDAEEDPEGVADDVHEDDGGKSEGKAHLSQPLTTLSPAEDVPCSPDAHHLERPQDLPRRPCGSSRRYASE